MKLSQTIVSGAFVAAQLWATTQASPVIVAQVVPDPALDDAIRDATVRTHITTDVTIHKRLGKSWWDKLSRDQYQTNMWARYRCFGSGSWVKSLDVINNLDNVCLGTEQSFQRTGFDYGQAVAAAGKGTEQTFHIDSQGECEGGSCQANGGNPSPNTIYAYMGAGSNPTKHANYESCKFALQRITELCKGDHDDTRGGFFWFDDSASDGPVDRTYYGIDPTAEGKGH